MKKRKNGEKGKERREMLGFKINSHNVAIGNININFATYFAILSTACGDLLTPSTVAIAVEHSSRDKYIEIFLSRRKMRNYGHVNFDAKSENDAEF